MVRVLIFIFEIIAVRKDGFWHLGADKPHRLIVVVYKFPPSLRYFGNDVLANCVPCHCDEVAAMDLLLKVHSRMVGCHKRLHV